jgi:hypothetical protein
MLMKRLTLVALVALTAVGLVTVAFACDSEKTADKAAGCPHAAQAKAGCTHADGAAAEAKEAGCNHAAKTDLAEYKDTAGGCPFHSKATESQRAALMKGETVTLVGQVVCASCDLKQSKECKSVLKTENGVLYTFVGNDAFEKLAAQTRHGEKKVEIVATSAKDADEAIILLQSFKLLG